MGLVALCLLCASCFAWQPATWMADLRGVIGNRTLQELTLPGTHDSGAYNLTETLIGLPDYLEEMLKVSEALHLPIAKIIDGWSKSQQTNFYEQFSDGIRYADVRACWDGSENIWRTCHGPVLGNPMEVLLNDTKRFLVNHPGELVVLEVSHYMGSPNNADVAVLAELYVSFLGDFMVPRAVGLETPLATLIDRGQRALVTFVDDTVVKKFPQLWNATTIINSYANSPVLKTMEEYNAIQAKLFADHNRFFNGSLYKLSWTLTPNAGTVLEMLVPGRPHTLLELADVANPALAGWYRATAPAYKYPILGNILITDHQSRSDVVSVVLSGLLSNPV